MSERKWTPGPWLKTSDSGEIASIDGHYIGRAIGAVTREGSANANLMASAPELYEALEALRNCIQETRGPDAYAAVEAADAALAKARGEAPQ